MGLTGTLGLTAHHSALLPFPPHPHPLDFDVLDIKEV